MTSHLTHRPSKKNLNDPPALKIRIKAPEKAQKTSFNAHHSSPLHFSLFDIPKTMSVNIIVGYLELAAEYIYAEVLTMGIFRLAR